MNTFQHILGILWTTVKAIVEVGGLTLIYWRILRFFRHTRAIYALASLFVVCIVVSILNRFLGFSVFSLMATSILHAMPVVILILFPEEIRRLLTLPMLLIGRKAANFKARKRSVRQTKLREMGVDEILKTVCCLTTEAHWRSYLRGYFHLDLEEERLSRKNTGALIAIEGMTGLEEIRDAGVQLDCQMNYRLLRSIFYTGTVLHDGGVILRFGHSGLRITAAGCHFPAESQVLGGPVHTRQNALRGMAEKADAFVLMVSEETGSVLIADNADRQRIRRMASPDELREALGEFLMLRQSADADLPSGEPLEDKVGHQDERFEKEESIL